MNKEYKALFVKTKTHHKVVVNAKKLQLTVDQYVIKLLGRSRDMKIKK